MLNEPYLVSILVPVYKVERYIERCARSLFEQTYQNLEFVFVDDCGGDRSIDILNDTIADYPNIGGKVKIVQHEKNRALKAARNTGIKNAQGKFVIHIDSDDWVDKNLVEKLVKKQLEDDFDIVSCEHMTVSNGTSFQSIIKDCSSKEDMLCSILCHENEPTSWGRLIRTSLFRDNNIIYDEFGAMSEDWGTTPRIFYYANKIASIHEPLVLYNKENENSATSHFNEKKLIADCEAGLLYDFFCDKDAAYIKALNIGTARSIIGSLMNLSLNHDARVYNVFKQLAYGLDKQAVGSLGWKYRFAYKLYYHKFVLSFYVRMGLGIKTIARKLK